jgi:NADH-quinone oxidoreductase subunit F/NAD(P)H dehydrogenase (quinone)/NADP-reducing hydrogenase subunit HndC
MLQVLEKITRGEGKDGDIELLEELSEVIKEGALCGLGQTGPNPVLSTLQYFRDEYEAHIYEKRCPAKRCAALLRFEVDQDVCTKCGICFKNCPSEAIAWKKKEPAYIDKSKCIKCMTCFSNCPADAIF